MKIQRKTVDGSAERKILTGMIVSTKFLEGAISFYDPDLLETDFVRTIAEWCSLYFQRYRKAPGIHIKDIFDSHSDRIEPAKRDLISDLLEDLSGEYERAEQLNVPYLLDQAEAFFKSKSLNNLAQDIKGCLLEGNVSEAEQALGGYKRVGRPMSLGGNPFRNAETIQRAFEQDEKPLFTLPGPLGRLVGRELNRDHFLAILAPEKRGKTWWLNELAIRASLARCNVALFQIGDMSEEQTVLRLGVRMCGKSNQERYCGEQIIPCLDCKANQQGKCLKGLAKNSDLNNTNGDPVKAFAAFEAGAKHKPCTECVNEKYWRGAIWWRKHDVGKPLTWREAWKVGGRFLGRMRGRDFRLSVHPSDQLSVTGLLGILDNWESFEDFIPDVIVIDYADNLAPEDRREEPRHQANRTWKMLRGLSQERHCLVVVATQANAASYDQESLSMKNFSEDKRKFAHVTSMFGLNQTPGEKRAGLMRLNAIVLREDEFFSSDEVTVGQCLRIGKPLLFSY